MPTLVDQYGYPLGGSLRLTDSARWGAFYGIASHSGKAVTPETALNLAAAWACTRLNSQAVSMLPLAMYEKDGKGGRNPIDHPLAEIIGESPNADQTSLEYWEAVTAWLCINGNSYSEIATSGERVTALNLLPSDQVVPVRSPAGDLTYRYNDRGRSEEFPPERVFHVKGFGFGGDLGLSPIRFGVQTLGSALATDETAGKLFGNGLMPSGVLSAQQELGDDQRTQLTDIMKQFVGSKNAGKMMVLESGLKFEQLSLDPETMQMLETRRFNIEEICRWFGVPPIIVGHAAQGQTMWGSGVEAILIQWLTTGLNPFLTRIERRIRKQLIGAGERRRVYAEFNREALLQADSAAKATFLSQMTQNGLMTRNEGRSKLNLPRMDGGDVLTAQTNLAPLDQIGASDPRAAMRNALGIQEPA